MWVYNPRNGILMRHGSEEPGDLQDIRLVVDTIPTLAWSARPDGSADFFNQRWLDYTGLSAEQALDWGWKVAIHPGDLPRILEAFREALNSVKPFEVEGRFRRFDGEFRWFLFRGSPLHDRSGKVAKWYGTNTDIEERKRAEDALRKSEERWRSVFENSAIGVALTDLNGRFLATNHVYQTIVGYTEEELCALHFLDVTHEDYREANWALITELLEGKRRQFQIEKKYLRKDGSSIWVSNNVSLVPGTERVPRFIMALSEDITQRKRAEKALQQSEGYLAEAQRLTRTGSWASQVSQKENVYWSNVYWSKEMFRIFGLDPGPTPPTPMEVARRWHPEEVPHLERLVEKAIRDKTDIETDHRLLLPDGTAKYVHVVGHPVVNASGDVIELVGTTMDVTEQHEARAALESAFEQIKQEQTELRRSEADLHEAQRLSHTGSWKHDVSSGKVTVSPEVYRIFGVTADEDTSAIEFWLSRNHPEDGKRIRELFERSEIQKTDYQADYRIVLPGGTVKYLHAIGHPVLNDSGDLIEFVGTVMDVSAAKQAEEKIRQSERELRQLIDLTPFHITEFGPDGTPLYNNQAALNYHGLTLEEWRNADLDTLLHPQDAERMRREHAAQFRGGSPCEFEIRLRRKDGQYRWFAFRYNAMRDEQGHPIRWYAAASDIEDRKQAEQRLRDENVALREEIDKAFMFEEIVGSSPALQTVLSSIVKVAPTDSTVLITGETGTGKELIARAIHKHSQRSGQAFISVNCASIPSSLIASELFGHEKGAFTGAVQRRQGRFEMAHSGTIFLDEVGELPADTQIALLRVLQERQFERVGGTRTLPTDVRVIAATNRNLTAAIAAGTFRADLFYRLNVFPIEVPPLRKRREDIPMLVEYFVKRYAEKVGKQIRKIDRNTLAQCQSYPWPGNIRELQNIVERSVILCGGDTFWIERAWLASLEAARQEMPGPLPDTLQNQEKEMIEAALEKCKGKVAGPKGAAAKLGIPRSTLDSKIKLLKIKKHKFVAES